MNQKNTDDLRQELMHSPNLDEFLSDNRENFSNESVPEVLNRILQSKNISKSVLAKQSGISEVYLHQIFAGKRNPSRNRGKTEAGSLFAQTPVQAGATAESSDTL